MLMTGAAPRVLLRNAARPLRRPCDSGVLDDVARSGRPLDRRPGRSESVRLVPGLGAVRADARARPAGLELPALPGGVQPLVEHVGAVSGVRPHTGDARI